ncbi:hypothetical protein, partial [Burkholderia sp. MSMB175]|uniref:hypothetical protein n=1 Tax=Burkholderia sp. MSMB175 TaxID=1086510 RepID=UPI001CA4D0D5
PRYVVCLLKAAIKKKDGGDDPAERSVRIRACSHECARRVGQSVRIAPNRFATLLALTAFPTIAPTLTTARSATNNKRNVWQPQ